MAEQEHVDDEVHVNEVDDNVLPGSSEGVGVTNVDDPLRVLYHPL